MEFDAKIILLLVLKVFQDFVLFLLHVLNQSDIATCFKTEHLVTPAKSGAHWKCEKLEHSIAKVIEGK